MGRNACDGYMLHYRGRLSMGVLYGGKIVSVREGCQWVPESELPARSVYGRLNRSPAPVSSVRPCQRSVGEGTTDV
jgi:hypothetical protein